MLEIHAWIQEFRQGRGEGDWLKSSDNVFVLQRGSNGYFKENVLISQYSWVGCNIFQCVCVGGGGPDRLSPFWIRAWNKVRLSGCLKGRIHQETNC